MSVKQIGPRNWAARPQWQDAEGKLHKPYRSGFKTKKAALQWEAEQLEQSQGVVHTAATNLASVRQLHNEYVSRLVRLGRSPKTVEYYENSAKRWLPLIGDRRLASLTPADIQEIINRGIDQGQSAATVRGTYRAIRAELKMAENLELIARTPCRGIELPAETAHEAVICTPEDVQALFAVMYEQNHPLYIPSVLAVMCALRRGEAIGLRWQDVDLETGEARIRANLVNVTGGQYLKGAKTRSSMDTVILPASLVEELRGVRKHRLALGLYRPGDPGMPPLTPLAQLDPGEFVSLSEKNEVFHPATVWERLRKFQLANGLKVHGWHDLRHTYGTLMAEAGVDLVTISKAMRHSSTTITANLYISNTTGIKRKATDQIGQILQIKSQTVSGAPADEMHRGQSADNLRTI